MGASRVKWACRLPYNWGGVKWQTSRWLYHILFNLRTHTTQTTILARATLELPQICHSAHIFKTSSLWRNGGLESLKNTRGCSKDFQSTWPASWSNCYNQHVQKVILQQGIPTIGHGNRQRRNVDLGERDACAILHDGFCRLPVWTLHTVHAIGSLWAENWIETQWNFRGFRRTCLLELFWLQLRLGNIITRLQLKYFWTAIICCNGNGLGSTGPESSNGSSAHAAGGIAALGFCSVDQLPRRVTDMALRFVPSLPPTFKDCRVPDHQEVWNRMGTSAALWIWHGDTGTPGLVYRWCIYCASLHVRARYHSRMGKGIWPVLGVGLGPHHPCASLLWRSRPSFDLICSGAAKCCGAVLVLGLRPARLPSVGSTEYGQTEGLSHRIPVALAADQGKKPGI